MASKPKRILFLVPYFTRGVGGAERVTTQLLRQLDKTEFEYHLARMQSGNSSSDDVPEGVYVHDLRVSRMRYALPGIVRLIWRVRPQTVLATVSYLNVMLLLAKPFLPRGIRVLLREATTPTPFVQKDVQHPGLWRWLYRHLYRHADKIVCLSDAMLEDMAMNFAIPREKLVRIYNPVDIAGLRQIALSRGNPFPSAAGPQLVVAGRLRREKGVDVLLNAMPAVLQSFPDVRLTVLGEGPQEKELKQQVAQLGLADHVDFRGFQANPWPYLANADLFVLSSRFEGMPNALLEALALGTPAVAADSVTALHEIAESNEDMLLVPPENPQALAEGIISFLARPRTGRASSEQAARRLQKFDLQHTVKEYSRLF